jgi:hypothetical protein
MCPTLPSAGKDFVNLVWAVCVCTRTGYGKFVILVNNALKTGKIELDMLKYFRYLFDFLIICVENIYEEFWYFKFVFTLTIRLDPYLIEAPERSLGFESLQLPPSITFQLHCFSCISFELSGHSLQTNVDYDKDVLIIIMKTAFGRLNWARGGCRVMQKRVARGKQRASCYTPWYFVLWPQC